MVDQIRVGALAVDGFKSGSEQTAKIYSGDTVVFSLALSVIWHCEISNDRIYELSTTDFSAVRNAAGPGLNPTGIGGAADVIWHCDANVNNVYELSTTDFSVVRSANSPTGSPQGIGGS